ncbi:radical SAM protein [Clostridium sp. MSJ-11]|uniref:Radical SAM protein n=1 Tax=Clostridium mobile TaxID=2841512 RepID=A0ABS6EE29_9CLOT|nr:radical SAM protein [Clostridium mobile]MBU5483465.1 radical SAM protein [Clostridium mobile]
MNMLPTNGTFLISENCNLRCKYCFVPEKNPYNMTEEVAKKGIDLLYENAEKQNKDHVNVLLFGGEPLLNSKLIEVIFIYGLKKQKETGIKFTSDIITNGTIMNDYIYWLFMEYKDKVNLSCQLSIDGVKEVHDMYRVNIDGSGSFDKIAKNIVKFKEIYKTNPEMLTVHGCINRKSLPYLFEGYKFFREEWNMKNIWFMPVHEEGWTESDVDIYDREQGKIYDYIIDKIKYKNEISELNYFTPYNKCLYPSKKKDAPCGAGKTLITITAKGDIYPCHNFYFNDNKAETKIGDVWNGIDLEKIKPYKDYTCDNMSCDKKCEHYNCYRCIATNWVHNGDMLQQIQGCYCKMSLIDKKYTDKMKVDLIELGLYKERYNSSNQARKDEEYYNKYSTEILAKAFKLMLLELQDIKANQNVIQKTLVKLLNENKEVV